MRRPGIAFVACQERGNTGTTDKNTWRGGWVTHDRRSFGTLGLRGLACALSESGRTKENPRKTS